MTVAETLNAAADYIEEHGWCQHTVQDNDGRVCLVGALANVTANGSDEYPQATKALRKSLRVRDHIDWNNAPERTKKEVIAALRAAAETAR